MGTVRIAIWRLLLMIAFFAHAGSAVAQNVGPGPGIFNPSAGVTPGNVAAAIAGQAISPSSVTTGGLTNNGGVARTGSSSGAALSSNTQPAAPVIVSGFTTGTTYYYWWVPEDLNGAQGLISNGTGTSGNVGTMSNAGQVGALAWELLRTATNTQPNHVSANTLVGFCITNSGVGCSVSDNSTTTTAFAWNPGAAVNIKVPYLFPTYGLQQTTIGEQFTNTGDTQTQTPPSGESPIDIYFPYGNSTYWIWMVAASTGLWYAGFDDSGSGYLSTLEFTAAPSNSWISQNGPHNAIFGSWAGTPLNGHLSRPNLIIGGDSDGGTVNPLVFGDSINGISGNTVSYGTGLGELAHFDPAGNLALDYSAYQGGAVPPGAAFDAQCSNSTSTEGPAGANEMLLNVVYEPAPFSFPNTNITYYGGTADAAVESDVCIYKLNSAGTSLTLLANSGLIAIGSGNQNVALGGGASNLMLNSACTGSAAPAPCCTGSGTGACTNTSQPAVGQVYPPGYYAKALASVATTAKLRECAGQGNYVHSSADSAPSGFCPATVAVTMGAVNNGGNPLQVGAW